MSKKKYPYKRLKLPNGKLIDQHRLIMQGMLCRELRPDEVVHHKDGDPTNNQPCNLELMTRSEHSRLHAIEDRVHERFSEKRNEFPKGNLGKNALFTYVEADAIRKFCHASSESLASIARTLGVQPYIIRRIASGESY